jgi:hypothetical protein
MTARDHNKLLSIFYFIMAGLQLVGGLVVALIYGLIGAGMLSTARREEEQFMGGVFLGMAVLVGFLMVVIGGFSVFTASKVLKEKPVGRTLAIVLSILMLFSFPLGTALGIYGLWFFFGEIGKNFYAGLASGNWQPTPPPPAPNSWQ